MKYKGQLKGFPEEVVEKMLERQVEQGNERDVSVFEEDRLAVKFEGGFTWHKTLEGYRFWDDVIAREEFDLFFERYPNPNTQREVITWRKWPCECDRTKSYLLQTNNGGFIYHKVGFANILESFSNIVAIAEVKGWQ